MRALAERTLTAEQLEAVQLKAYGYGLRRIATILGISKDSARDRLDRASTKLQRELERMEADA